MIFSIVENKRLDIPDLSLESVLAPPVAGIDEAGRGPWAGPVVAAAVILPADGVPDGIDDSKRLPRERRVELYEQIRATATVGIGEASVEEIDVLNILEATMLAMRRAVEALETRPSHVLVDGNRLPDLACPAQAIVKGDSRSLSIAAASIVACRLSAAVAAKLTQGDPRPDHAAAGADLPRLRLGAQCRLWYAGTCPGARNSRADPPSPVLVPARAGGAAVFLGRPRRRRRRSA